LINSFFCFPKKLLIIQRNGISIYYGIKTGYNEAFIVDQTKYEGLIEADPNSSKILKPILRGSDIERYQANWHGLWLIDTHNGLNSEGGKIPRIDVHAYPAIKRHLDQFYPVLEKRYDKGCTPYNLRNCAYHEEFAKTKLLWSQMSTSGKFALCGPDIMCNQKCFMVTGTHLFYLCAILNSKLVTWLVKKYAVTTGWGLIQWDKYIVEDIPIIHLEKTDISISKKIEKIVDSILSKLNYDPFYDVSKYQQEIDGFIFELYGLTSDEQEIILNTVNE